MTSVTIDLEDLETLVMTTGALKTIEGAMAQRRGDPFVRQHLDFTSAHDRLASVMRNARRVEAGTLVAWDGDLTTTEILLLGEVEDSEAGIAFVQRKGGYDSLAAKGCVVIGQCCTGIVWAGEKETDLRPGLEYAVKITDRGREKLAKIDAARAAALNLEGEPS